ncbi:hypothetical protein TRL7639_02727 [Falsiruegeria litorea R37]|uniref:Uncharacterized protein n=2 Tax=Falsiruegeria litorea TaxID=1280831 RepID=A0A1Y5SVH4_9RHOB|nr:hypothetical protein TRL7639_02727 [Falsiruegeria litorea R37]
MRAARKTSSWFCAVLFGFLVTESAAQEDIRIPVCKDGQLYSLPQYGQLYSKGLHIRLGTGEDSDKTPYIWKVGQPPLNLRKFTYNSFGGSRSSRTPPVMELLLGRKSMFAVSQLSIASRLEALDWYLPPDERATQSTMTRHNYGARTDYEIDIRFFEQIVFVTCRQGLPVYSSDPQSYNCGLRGRLPDGTALSVYFDTGKDLEGHWPPVSKLNELWPAAIDELEQAIQNLLPPGKEETICN